MALQQSYKQYLASPSIDALAPEATIHYIPTLSTIHEARAILKHLRAQDDLLKVKQNFLNVIESESSICVEAETTIHFLQGGGSYLPGLDDNLVADKTVTLPVIHIVTFNPTGKIQQIRLFWEQASLLKSVDVIGSRARNWPISDGRDQVQAINSSAAAAGELLPTTPRRQSRVGANGDKYTSLSLFAPRENKREESPANDVRPRESAKPPPREYHDLFAAGASAPDDRPVSPVKESGNAVKGGAGKHFQPNRLFDEDEEPLTSPKKGIKTSEKKYEHFDFGEAPVRPKEPSSKHNKHGSQWTFEDFATPQKPKGARPEAAQQQQRHFGWHDDEQEPIKPDSFRPNIPQPRPDASHHFEFNDQNTPKGDKVEGRPVRHNAVARGNGMYEDHIVGDNGMPAPDLSQDMPLGNITNVNKSGNAIDAQRRKNFSSNFDIKDDITGPRDENEGNAAHEAAQKKPEAAARANMTLQPNWSMYDTSPQTRSSGIKISGDGAGQRKGEKGWWEYDD